MKKMDGHNTFVGIYVEDMYKPVERKVKKLTKYIDDQFKLYNIRGFNIERKEENLFIYMKNLAYKKYRKDHLIEIFRKYNKNILGKNELNKIKRTRSHKIPYHKMNYYTLIYRNLNNFKYRPYLFPLTKEMLSNKIFLNLTDRNIRKKYKKKPIFTNPHLELRRKNLIKVNEQLKEKEKIKFFQKIKVLHKAKSNPILNKDLSYKNNLIDSLNNQRMRFQGKLINMRNEKNLFNHLDNNISNCGENTTNYKSFSLKSMEMKRGKKLILPKIVKECESTIDSLKKIKNNLKFIKYKNKENKSNEEININNILKLNLQQLHKLFFINNKNKKILKKFKKKGNISKDDQSKHMNININMVIGSDSNRNNKKVNN